MGTIVVENLGKSYKSYKGRWGRIASWMGLNRGVLSENWILRGLDFELKAGEAVGIVGQNGAGKSTLLKLITGTIRPTEGSISMVGRVSALLELGMGFHPDLTGRQNAYLSGSLLGLTQAEITALMPSIEAFSEIGEYLDQPVRVYSSGMQARLAFSVATAVRPDILIVDEVLSVGDAYFQHKSFQRIRDFRDQGTTLLIVSHDRAAIQAICNKAILISDGKIAIQGDPESVMDYYNALLANHQDQNVRQMLTHDNKVQTRSGSGEAVVNNIAIIDLDGQRIETLNVGQEVILRVDVEVKNNIARLVLGFAIKDRLGQIVFGTNTDISNQAINNVHAGQLIRYDISFIAYFGLGNYSIQTALVSTDTHLENNYEWRDLALLFNVTNANKLRFAGQIWLDTNIEIINI